MSRQLSRREVLRLLGAGAAGALLAGCAAPTPERIVEKVVETVVVEKEGETVVETRVVEKVVEVTAVPPAPEEITLSVMPTINGGEDFWNTVKALYEERYPNRTVEMNHQANWDTLWTALRGSIAAGEAPDVWGTQETGPLEFWKAGATLPLDAFAEADEFWLSDPWCEVTKVQIEKEYTANGKLMGVPIYTAPMFMFYNKALFQEAGVEVGDSMPKDYTEYALKIKEAGVADYPVWIGPPNWLWGPHWYMWAHGSPGWITEDGTTQKVDAPETLDALHWYWNLVKTDKVLDESYLVQAPTAQEEALAKKIALWEEGAWGLFGYSEVPELWENIGVLPLGHKQIVGGSALMISARTTAPQAAWDFCMTANDPDNMADNWLIATLDTVPVLGAYSKPQVAAKAPVLAELLGVMSSEAGLVGAGIPWFWDCSGPFGEMWTEMQNAITWEAAEKLAPEYAARTQEIIDQKIAEDKEG